MKPVSDFKADLDSLRGELDGARGELITTLASVSDGALARAAEAEDWTVRRILEHVVLSERLYAGMITHLRGAPLPSGSSPLAASSVADFLQALEGSRESLLQALEGVDEPSFYRSQEMGGLDFSVRGLAQHTAEHDHDHNGQIRAVLGLT